MVRSSAIAFVFVAALVSPLVGAGEPTAEQLKLFQQLPADQQRALLEQMRNGALPAAPAPAAAPVPPHAAAVAQPVTARPPDVRRDSWREFDMRRLALEDPELEACLRRYEASDLRAVRAVARDAGATAVTPAMLPWDLRRRVGLLDGALEPERLTPGLDEPAEVAESLKGAALWGDIWSCVDLLTQYDATGGALRPFGYELFSGTPDTFAPPVDIPVPGDYLIGPGDTIDVQFYGKENAQHRLTVSRDGQIGLPGIGPMAVAGLTFERLVKTIEGRVSQQMIGVRASVTMGPLRTMQVFVLGEAHRPGAYTVSSLATITHALFASGGIDPIGSLRRIELKRGGKVVRTLDLYDLLLGGDTRDDVRLQPGDAILVPPVGATIAIAGEVRRPAIYEVRPGDTVGTALELAGGVLPTAYPQATRLERIGTNSARSVQDIDATTEKGRIQKLQSGDYLRVYSMLERMESFVRVNGHVLRPGVYEWRAGMRISDVLRGVEDLQAKPDLGFVLVRRELGAERKIDVLSVDLAQAWAAKGGDADLPLQARDQVLVFGRETNRQLLVKRWVDELALQATAAEPLRRVNINGVVRSPGDYPLLAGMKVSDLIKAGGGLREEAYALEAEITRYEVVDGQRRQSRHIKFDLAAVLAGDPGADAELAAYDVLSIKPIPQWRETETVTLRGEVRFPGVYTLQRGESLKSVVERAGGLTPEAYAEGAVFSRIELQRREQAQLERLSTRLQADLTFMALQQSQSEGNARDALAVGQAVMAEAQRVKAVGRLVIDLPAVLRGELELEARAGDTLVVPRVPQEVTVIGEVQYSTSHIFNPDFDQDDYVDQSGGATVKAKESNIYVVRANGAVDVGSAANRIKPGDTIVVPLDTERMQPLVFWATVSQIMYQFALAAASANAIGVF